MIMLLMIFKMLNCRPSLWTSI